MISNGGDPFAGRKLAPSLREAGYQNVFSSASYEIYEEPALIGEYLAEQLDPFDVGAAATFRRWHRDPNALFAQAWVEAIGRKR